MSASVDSCSSPILEPDRSSLLQEALADSQLQAVKAQLESRGFSINTEEAQAVQLAGGQQLLIPFGEDAHLVWTRTNGQAAAVGLVRQGNKTLNVSADGQERIVRFLPVQKVEKLLRKLREKPKFQQFEGKLAQKGKRIGKIRALFDETNKIAILGIAAEGNDERIAHQVRIKLKADKDDEPEDDTEPAIQATACRQATGEAVAEGARMQAQMYDAGEGGDLIGSSYDVSEGRDYGTNICTSQWGYAYNCIATTPSVSLSPTGLTFPQTFITQQTQASFTIWNGGGGRLTGTISAPAPFSIISGGSFSLLPGQPQQVTVKFSSATAGSFSQNLTITSNAGTKLMPVSGVAHKVTFSPATVNLGEGMFVVTEQCGGETGECMPYTKKVGLPVQGKLAVKNEGMVTVSLNLSTSAPFSLTAGGALTLAAGQSAEVAVRFDPADSGSFTGAVQVTLQNGQGSLSSGPLTGKAHKIEISPPELGFGLLLLDDSPEDNYKEQQLVIKNQGVTNLSLALSASAPFTVVTGNSFGLAPSESYEATVRFTPPAPGEFQGSVRLAVGQLAVEVPAKASAMNKQDFLQMLAELSQIQEMDTVIPGRRVDVGLLGVKDLTAQDLQALLELAESQDWSSAIPEQTGNTLLDFIISFLIDQAISLLLNTPGFDIGVVLADLELLAKIDPTFFHTNYQSWVDPHDAAHNNFRAFVNAMTSAISRAASRSQDPQQVARLWAAFGATSVEQAVEKTIQTVVDIFRTADATTKDYMRTIINWFGPMGVYFLATTHIIGQRTNSGVFSLALSSLVSIVKYLTDSNFAWFYKGSPLWEQIAQAMGALGNLLISDDPKVVKQAQQTLVALVFTASIANSGGWQIYGFRVRLYNLTNYTVADVVASTTLSTGKRVLIFAQFFHAFTGYDAGALDRLIQWVQYYATAELWNRITLLQAVFGNVPAGELATRYEPGIVVAVSKADTDGNGSSDTDDAVAKLSGKSKNCGGCFFGVVIEIDPDKEEVTNIIGVGISQEEAIEIARRMGITLHSKWSLDQLILWIMGMFMR